MKLIDVENLKGGEILAEEIITSEYKVLLNKETVLKDDVINKLKNLKIKEVYIKEYDQAKVQEIILLRSEIEDTFKNKIKDVIKNHTYDNDIELSEISSAAAGIINNILEENEVINKVYDIKERSSDIFEHSINLCSLATITALKLKMPEKTVHDIGVGCLLHDIGLESLLIEYDNQDFDELSKAEKVEFMKHPVYGYSEIKDCDWLSNISKQIVLYHHETLDGMGYPLHAKQISYETGVVSVCDIFDEMICGIGCKKLKVYEAIEYLKTFINIKFYPKIVNALLEFVAVYPVGKRVKLSDGSVGKVIRQNSDFPDRPVIFLEKDSNENILTKGVEIDLIKVNNIFIERELS